MLYYKYCVLKLRKQGNINFYIAHFLFRIQFSGIVSCSVVTSPKIICKFYEFFNDDDYWFLKIFFSLRSTENLGKMTP